MLTPASSQFSACGHAQILEVAIHVYGNGGKDTRQDINGSLMIISNLTSHSTQELLLVGGVRGALWGEYWAEWLRWGRAGVESSEVLFSCEILMCRRPRGQWAAGRHQSRADLASWPPIGGQAGAMGSDHRPLGPRSANQGRGSGGCGPMAGRDQCPRPISRAAGRVNTADQGTMSLGPPLGCFSRRRSCARIWLAIAEEVLLRKEQSTMVTFIF